MECFAPAYYHRFRCLGGTCPDSCCKEWAVDIDDTAAAFYRGLPGALGDDLRSFLQEEDGGFVLSLADGRCPMWRQDGLCRIQAELGHDALCRVCREFPRLRHDYGSFVELGLELSCPEAARLIFQETSHAMVKADIPGGDAPDYDTEAMSILQKSRQEALLLLDSGDYALAETLGILLLYAHRVQAQLDGGEEAVLSPEKDCQDAKKLAAPGSWEAVFAFFRGLEILKPQWRRLLDSAPRSHRIPESLVPLARYGIQRYWLQAVSDFDLIGRVKWIIISCLMVSAIGGDPVQTAQLFSKEIENDPDNMEAILDGAYTEPAFSDTSILGLLYEGEYTCCVLNG